MAGLRTAPTIDGLALVKIISVRYIDFTGDKRAVSIRTDAAVTDVQIEAMVAASVPGSNASIYEVQVTEVYSGVALKGNADEAVWENVNDNIVLQFKDPVLGVSLRNYLPSPSETWFTDGTDFVDADNAEFIAWKNATDVVMPTDYFPVGVRFTPRKDNNPSLPL